jgi:hypothetical protein
MSITQVLVCLVRCDSFVSSIEVELVPLGEPWTFALLFVFPPIYSFFPKGAKTLCALPKKFTALGKWRHPRHVSEPADVGTR